MIVPICLLCKITDNVISENPSQRLPEAKLRIIAFFYISIQVFEFFFQTKYQTLVKKIKKMV